MDSVTNIDEVFYCSGVSAIIFMLIILKSVTITQMYTSEYVPSKMGCKLRWDGNQKLSAVMINFNFLEFSKFSIDFKIQIQVANLN